MATHDQTSTVAAPSPGRLQPVPRQIAEDRRIRVLGVRITDVTRRRAVRLIEQMIREYDGRSGRVYFVNAHTLNLAADDDHYRRVLNAAEYVFGDGTGVRWASRLQGTCVRDNLVGTDLVYELFRETAGRGYRYFLLGAGRQTVRRAAQHAAAFPGWTQVGYHHGYLSDPTLNARAIRRINRARPDVLLVGMGNPLQERWIHRHRQELDVPVCLGVGGLFSYWAGELRRAPPWLRRCGSEWVGILVQQPHKARRYLLGNGLFLMRIFREAWQARRRTDPSRAARMWRAVGRSKPI